MRPDQTVIVRGDRIAAVGSASTVRVPVGARVVDATGEVVIPGLRDLHVHTLGPGRPETFLPVYVANGVTGVRDMGTLAPLDRRQLDEHLARAERAAASPPP